MNDFLQFLSEPIAQRSLWACAVIGSADGLMSALIVLRRSSLQIGTLSCALLPGLALAILLFGLGEWSLLLGALTAALLVGLSSLFVARCSAVDADTSLSLIHSAAFALGYLILLSLGLQQKVDDWLFGNILSMSNADLCVAFVVAALTFILLTLFRRPLLLWLFDPIAAAALGLPTRALSYGAFALIILALVSSLQAVGSFLSLGLLVIPGATMRLLTRRAQLMFPGATLIGGSCSVLAFFLSFPLGWHLGATIILLLALVFLLAFLLSRRGK